MIGKQSPNFKDAMLFFCLLLAAFFYLFHGIDNVPFLFWDESLYVNAARAYLTTTKPFPIPDHPPLGKEILALGILIFGDGPAAWRFFAVFFGSLAMTLVAFLIWRMTGRRWVAIFVFFLMWLDPMFVVHFRLGQLDAPLTAFLLAATVLTYEFMQMGKVRWALPVLIAVFLGLALATKMLTIAFIPVLWAAVVYRIWREPNRAGNLLFVSVAFGFIPWLVFGATYLILGYNIPATWELTRFIFAWHRSAKAPSQFVSRWYEWFYLKNPVLYFFQKTDQGFWQAVMATGNFVLWIGAELGALYAVIRNYRRPEVLMVFALIALQILIYTQKHSGLLHYMTEILPFLYILLGVAIADLFTRYGGRYKRFLQVDLAIFAVGALIVFMNYWPYLWGRPLTQNQFERMTRGMVLVPEGNR